MKVLSFLTYGFGIGGLGGFILRKSFGWLKLESKGIGFVEDVFWGCIPIKSYISAFGSTFGWLSFGFVSKLNISELIDVWAGGLGAKSNDGKSDERKEEAGG